MKSYYSRFIIAKTNRHSHILLVRSGSGPGKLRCLAREVDIESIKSKDAVLVFGGTGHYGREIVRALVEMGERVRVMSRNRSAAQSLLGDSVEVVQGDITDKESVLRALEKSKAIVVAVSAMAPKTIRQIARIEEESVLALFDTAAKMGVLRVVYLSSYELVEDVIAALRIEKLARLKRNVETGLKASRLDWTVLGCPPTMALFAAFLKGKSLIAPGGLANPMPTISPADVGSIAAQAAVRRDLSARRFRLCSARAETSDSAAAVISEILGKKITVKKIPLSAINAATFLLGLFNPFPRYLYMGLKVFNNFPADLIEKIPDDHQLLQETFSYSARTLMEDLQIRLK